MNKSKGFVSFVMFLIGTIILLAVKSLYTKDIINNWTALGITVVVGIVIEILYHKYFKKK